ncbi:hypothetical protein BKH43_02305 [Helicobacter sp. 13S00401-1]|uniref:MATE family efflux transporter n=1 Tax=Helicobacter sp. 13S00401-1 TaxID=1905758 RepID=UPI000BA6853C|nr:MATE family efflux transporter [Helicobacter sp. 13S00401-1]PAF51062.1 hypothetical protein BKH43_02305 [Helicobacter sp. 13S00401-1]
MRSLKQPNLTKDSIFKLFLHYFVPITFTMLAMSSYSVFDGYFVSHRLGDKGIAAIGVAWPFFPLIIGISIMFAFGTSALTSFFLGKKKPQISRMIFNTNFYFLFVLSLIVGGVCYLLTGKIVAVLAPNLDSITFHLSVEYLKVIFLGLFALMLHPMLDISVINDKRPRLGMIAMITGAVFNIILNYYFLYILNTGIVGSAYATIIGHLIGSAILLSHFILRRGEVYFIKAFRFRMVLRALKYGFPQAISEFSASFTMWLYNYFLLIVAGSIGVALYGATLYTGFIYFTLVFAISQGLQPIISFNYGAREFIRLRKILIFGIKAAISISIFIYIVVFLFSPLLVRLFLQDDALRSEGLHAMHIYFIGYIFLAFNLFIAVFLQATQRVYSSIVVTFSYTLVFAAIIIPIFAKFFGLYGIWYSNVIAQILSLIVTVGVLVYEFKRGVLLKGKVKKISLLEDKKC